MKRSILTALALAASAGAQTPFTTGSTVTYTLGFVEFGGNTNGTLEPGESALIQISVAFSNQNTTAVYTPPSPPPGSGTIRGFAYGWLDLDGIANNGGNAEGAWNMDFVNPGFGPFLDGWDVVGPSGWGTPANSGSQLRGILFGQAPLHIQTILTTNPINLIWQGLWSPASYANRTVSFGLSPAAASGGFASTVLFVTGITSIRWVYCPSEFGSLSIPIIPAPPAALLLAAPLVGRRRRSTAELPQ